MTDLRLDVDFHDVSVTPTGSGSFDYALVGRVASFPSSRVEMTHEALLFVPPGCDDGTGTVPVEDYTGRDVYIGNFLIGPVARHESVDPDRFGLETEICLPAVVEMTRDHPWLKRLVFHRTYADFDGIDIASGTYDEQAALAKRLTERYRIPFHVLADGTIVEDGWLKRKGLDPAAVAKEVNTVPLPEPMDVLDFSDVTWTFRRNRLIPSDRKGLGIRVEVDRDTGTGSLRIESRGMDKEGVRFIFSDKLEVVLTLQTASVYRAALTAEEVAYVRTLE